MCKDHLRIFDKNFAYEAKVLDKTIFPLKSIWKFSSMYYFLFDKFDSLSPP